MHVFFLVDGSGYFDVVLCMTTPLHWCLVGHNRLFETTRGQWKPKAKERKNKRKETNRKRRYAVSVYHRLARLPWSGVRQNARMQNSRTNKAPCLNIRSRLNFGTPFCGFVCVCACVPEYQSSHQTRKDARRFLKRKEKRYCSESSYLTTTTKLCRPLRSLHGGGRKKSKGEGRRT